MTGVSAAASSTRCEMAALEQLPVGSAEIRQDFIPIGIVCHYKDSLKSAVFAILSMATRRREQSEDERAQK